MNPSTLRLAAALVASLSLSATVQADAAPAVNAAPGRVVFAVDEGAVLDNVDAGGAGTAIALPDTGTLMFGAGSDSTGALRIAKVGAAGALDPSFGTGGVASVPAPAAGGRGELLQVLRQSDGKLLLIGAAQTAQSSQTQFAPSQLRVTRLNADATIDRSYGTDGTAQSGLGEGCGACTTAALQPDGALVLTGTTGTIAPPPAAPNLHWAVARLTPAGGADQSFGSRGIATIPTAVSTSGFNVAVGPNGTIVTEAQSQGNLFGGSSQLLLTRLTSKGDLDTAFAGGRPIELPFPTGFLMLVQDDGAVVVNGQVGGSILPPARLSQQLLARYTASGALDSSFGSAGVADIGTAVDPSQLLPAPGRSLLVAGTPAYALAPGSGPIPGRLNVRLVTADGTFAPALGRQGRNIDLPFGGGGSSFLVSVRPRPVGSPAQNSFTGKRLVPRADGSYVVAGGVSVSQPTGEGTGFSIGRFAIAALTPSLTLDSSFGGPATPPRVAVVVSRQRAKTAYSRHGIRIVLRSSAEGLVRVKISQGPRAIAHSLLPVFRTAAHTLPVELTSYGNRYLRRHRNVRVTVTTTARDLLGNGVKVYARGRLR